MSFARELIALMKPTKLGSLHWAAKQALLKMGYRWELRRKGELKLGVLRKSWKKGRKGTVRRLVVLPGLGDSPLSWIPVFALAQGAVRKGFDEIVFADFPGFSGFLALQKSFHSMDLLCDAVFDLLDSLKPHTVFGHSLGGWLAAMYASECAKGARPLSPSGKKGEYLGPERCILIVPGGLFENAAQKESWRNSLGEILENGGANWRAKVFHREPLWFGLVAEDASRFLARDDIRQLIGSIAEKHSLESRVSEIRAEVWLFWTEHDGLLPVSCARHWMSQLSGPKTGVLFRRVGHSPHLENPAALASVLNSLLSGKTPHKWGGRWWKTLT